MGTIIVTEELTPNQRDNVAIKLTEGVRGRNQEDRCSKRHVENKRIRKKGFYSKKLKNSNPSIINKYFIVVIKKMINVKKIIQKYYTQMLFNTPFPKKK